MSSYASNTTVSVDRTQHEIKDTLRRYQVDRFGVMEERDRAFVMFEIRGMSVQMAVPMPDRNDKAFWFTPNNNRKRTPQKAYEQYDQECKRRWRALLLAIKAKLEAVDSGISTIETEFLPFIVLGDGQTVAQHLLPKLEKAVEGGGMPTRLMLPGPNDATE